MRISFFGCVLIIVIFLTTSTGVLGQIKLVPVQKPQPEEVVRKHTRINRTSATQDTVLALPFWDDFSTNASGKPDTSLWKDSENVQITDGTGISPPSYNVAVFNGIDAFGTPYRNDPNEWGLGDALTSQPIDLSTIAASQNDSVYLSFFYQKEGKGEIPDQEDSIRVQFKDADSLWVTRWVVSGEEETPTDTFTYVAVKVPSSYFHDNFQFRFQWFGRLSGPFDTWAVDYIMLNTGRHANESSFDDRTITSRPTSIFKDFHAIPFNQFFADTARYIGSASVGIATLSSRPDQAAEITALLRYGDQVDTIDSPPGQPSDVVFSSLERRTFAASPITASGLDSSADSLELELFVYFNASGDKLGEDSIDYRSNDSISARFILDDYYAYDDGTAEFGAGINQARGRLAVQFILSEPDILTAIDIHFTNMGGQGGQGVEFFVADELNDENDTVLYSQSQAIQHTGIINGFQRVRLNRSIPVNDTIYIGFRQTGNEFLPVGFDKNTDSSDKTFFNVLGSWDQDTTLQGSLMIRPIFGDDPILGNEQNQPESNFISLYPNPSRGKVFFKGSFQQASVYTVNGKKVRVPVYQEYNSGRFDFSAHPRGIYIIHFLRNNERQTEKIILY